MQQNLIEGNKLLTGLYMQLMTVNILIGLVQPCNQFVDSMLTGKGLGVAALNAYANIPCPASQLVEHGMGKGQAWAIQRRTA